MASEIDLEIKIADFGFAVLLDPEKGMQNRFGTLNYMAPELIKGSDYDDKVDVWSIGIITYQLLTGTFPHKGKSKRDYMQSILNDPIDYNLPVFEQLSP